MSEDVTDHDPIIKAILRTAGRSTLAFEQPVSGESPGTAFWYNDLFDSTPGREQIRQYLLTASELTWSQLGEFRLRDELADPALSAEVLVMSEFDRAWRRFDGLGVAAMSTSGLHAHARRKRWRWTTDEITEGLAATEADIAAITTDPVPAYVLGHSVVAAGPDLMRAAAISGGNRPKTVMAGTISRGPDHVLRWDGGFEPGLGGAPVFIAKPLDGSRLKLLCVGVALPGTAGNVVAPFDAIRRAVRDLSAIVPEARRPWWRVW